MLKTAIIVLVLDQFAKLVIVSTLRLKKVVAIMPHLNFHLAYNKGAAFGILAAAGGWQRWIFITIALMISVIILLWNRRLTKKDKWESLALGLILGGAWGNLLDRIRFGYVIDFLDFYIGSWHWYTFNVADIAICMGAALLVLLSFKD